MNNTEDHDQDHVKTQSKSSSNVDIDFGCFSFILLGFVLWGLIYGVTVNGRHYGISCTTSQGVVVDTGSK